VKAGDKLRFEPHRGGIRLVRDIDENVFEKWRGIGTELPVSGDDFEAVNKSFRKMRGHDDLD
jgi:hypothetical protein